MEQQNPTLKKTKRYTLRTFVQEAFLTSNFFIQNDLLTYASACAFSFLFSLLPVVIMCAVILIRVLKASPSVLTNLYQFDTGLAQILDVSHLVNSVLDFQGGIVFNVIVGIFIFWMARRLFNSTMKGIGCIFHKELVVRPLVSQLIVVAGEVLLVVVIACGVMNVYLTREISNRYVSAAEELIWSTLVPKVPSIHCATK